MSLDPYSERMRFPVVAVPGTAPVLAFQTFSLLPGASYSVRSVRVFVTPVNPRNVAWLSDLTDQQSAK